MAAWQLREHLRGDVGVRQRACGRMRYVKKPIVRGSESGSYFDGVLRCRSRVCPVCFLARRMRLLAEVRYVAEARSRETRKRPMLATLTVRHSSADGIAITKEVRKCWRNFISGREWQDFKTRHGVEWVCAEEITLGKHGWHPHIHVALLPRAEPSDMLVTTDWWFERWSNLVAKRMGESHRPVLDRGVDLRQNSIVDYVAKIAWELTDAGAVKGSTPAALIADGKKAEYLQLQTFRKGARDVTWSTGLRAHRDAFAELPAHETEPFAVLRGTEYERLADRGYRALLNVTEQHSVDEVAIALRYWGVRAEALGIECASVIDSE